MRVSEIDTGSRAAEITVRSLAGRQLRVSDLTGLRDANCVCPI